MAKAGELDLSDLHKGKVGEPADPLAKGDVRNANKPVKATKEQLLKEAEFILRGFLQKGLRQATDEELFGHLVPSEEQIKKAEHWYENGMNEAFKEMQKPVDNQEQEWGSGKMIDWDSLTEEEKAERNLAGFDFR